MSERRERLSLYLEEFKKLNVAVVGDVMLDQFIWGEVSRISPEAPVPIVEVRGESFVPGGAANVANNIRSLRGKVSLFGVVGNDAVGDKLLELANNAGIDCDGVLKDGRRPTTLKTRIIAHSQQVVRVDREKRDDIDDHLVQKLLEKIKKISHKLDALIVSDYGKGVISGKLMNALIDIKSENGLLLAVDPKVGHFQLYRKATVITPNHKEAGQAKGIEIKDEEALVTVGRELLADLSCDMVLITRGEKGMTLFQKKKKPVHIPTVAREVFDVTGAGDTVIAAFTLAMAAGATPKDAAKISNHAAGIVVGEVGTSTARWDELKRTLENTEIIKERRRGSPEQR